MRVLVLGFGPLVAIAVSAGCSSNASSHDGADAGNAATASFHMEQTVAGGQELFNCQYVTLPDVQGYLVKAQHKYTPGSHHILFYTTDLTSIPAGQDKAQNCDEGSGAEIMSHARGVLYGGQEPEGGETLPAGIGLPTTAKQVLIFQTHYLNSSASSIDATVDVDMTIDTGHDIKTKAGVFFFYDPFIDVPAGAKATASMRCPVPNDVTLITAQSHYHARGVGYAAYIDAPDGNLGTKPFYTSASWSSPPDQTMSMPIKAGSKIRWECDYDNSSGTTSYFQGQSAHTNEMCVFSGLYYPEISPVVDYCQSGGDYFGSGTANCQSTLSCLQGCGALSNGSISTSAPTCEQTCFVKSCASSSTPLMPLLQCMKGTCASSCSDMSSAQCKSCVDASCPAMGAACESDACP